MKSVPNQSLEYDDGLMLLDGEPFTGIGYLVDDAGQVVGDIEYKDGLEWGMKRGWHAHGELYYEGRFYRGVLHGKEREWHAGGQLAAEGDYELGFVLRKKRWDKEGNLIEEYELRETDPDYVGLENFREIYKADLARDKPDEPAS